MTTRILLTLSVALLLAGCGQETPPKQAANGGPTKEVASAPAPMSTPAEPAPPASVDQPAPPVAEPATSDPATPSVPAVASEPSATVANVDTSRLNLPTESADVPRNLQEITELSLDDDDQAITKIAALLTHENAAVRRKASEALRGMGTPYWRKDTPIPDLDGYIAIICQITRDPDADTRANGFNALQHLGAEAQPALPYLLAGLSDESGNIRMTAARTLQDIGPAAADIVPDIVRLRSASLKEAASLGEYDGKSYQLKGIANACAVALAGIGGPKARTIVPDLKRQVLEGNRADLEAESLGRFGEADFLISLVGHEKQITRQAAANGLAFVRPTTDRVVGALAKLTTDEEQQVRMTAIEAFGKCDPKLPSAVPVLVRAFDDEYEYAGRAAQRIVSTYEGAGAARLLALVRKMIKLDRDDFGQVYYYVDDKVENIPPLLEIMADANQPADIRAGAGFLLFQFDDDELEPHAGEIRAIYRDSAATPEARMYANLCLVSIDEEEFDGSLAAEVLKSSTITFAVIDTAENLYTDGSDEAYAPLLALLDHKDPELVTAAASSLLRFEKQGETTLPKLIALSESASEVDVLTQVAYSIGHFGSGSKPAEAALVKLCHHEDGDVQSAAAVSLGDMGITTPEAVAALRELLKDEYTWWEAAKALEEAGEVAREAIPDLLALLDKEDAPVPQTIYALAAMGESAVEPALDKILSIAESDDEEHRYAVAYAIDSFPEQSAKVEPVLIKLLADEDEDVVEAACESAANLKYAGSVPALVDVLQNETYESYTIQLALDALRAIGPDAKDAIPVVKHLAENEADQYVRERAGEVLAKIAPNDPSLMATRLMTIEPYDDDARRIVSQLGDAALPSLEKLLQSSDSEDRERGMWG